MVSNSRGGIGSSARTWPQHAAGHSHPNAHALAQHPDLLLSPDELTLLLDPLLIPRWYPLAYAPPLQRRIRFIGDVLGAIMALYPRQTHLPPNLLRTYGLYTELVPSTKHTVRRFHAFEWAAALGWPPILKLPTGLIHPIGACRHSGSASTQKHIPKYLDWNCFSMPIASMYPIYLPTFTINTN